MLGRPIDVGTGASRGSPKQRGEDLVTEKELRRTRLAGPLSFALMPLGVVAIVLFLGEAFAPVALLAVVPFAVYAYKAFAARCPRCSDPFFWSFDRGSNPWPTKCPHCGLSI